jgi:hypothetical protein
LARKKESEEKVTHIRKSKGRKSWMMHLLAFDHFCGFWREAIDTPCGGAFIIADCNGKSTKVGSGHLDHIVGTVEL